MTFDIMTLFPEMMDACLNQSIIGRARAAGKITVRFHNIRDYSTDKHRRVDDTPYGGGKGMLMGPEPIYNCWRAITEGLESRPLTVYLSPKGETLTQSKAYCLRDRGHVILLCGHYEGIDQRVIDEIVDEELSIGDYVLTGGELAAAIVVDCVSRLVDGVLSDSECYENETFSDGLLEYPQYTRPFEFHGKQVPEVLISGNHERIRQWRREQAMALTVEKRPDLLSERRKRLESE